LYQIFAVFPILTLGDLERSGADTQVTHQQ